MEALQAIATSGAGAGQAGALDLKALAAILYYSAGITRRRQYPGGEMYFRAAACTGALYEVELYLACGPLIDPEAGDLDAGLYHFDPAGFALGRLRAGDWRGELARAAGNEAAVERSAATIICTGTYWRNAWKYQARTYRHFFWDNGTILANLLAEAAALQVPARLVMGFVDDEVNRLLDLDTEREVAISMVALGKGGGPGREAAAQISALGLKAGPPARGEVDYPLMRETYRASCLASAEEVREWRGRTLLREEEKAASAIVNLKPLAASDAPGDTPKNTLEQVIQRRGSTRRFARLPIRFEQLSTMLIGATQGIAADFLEPGDPTTSRLNDLYLIVNAVEGLAAGTYYLNRSTVDGTLTLAGRGGARAVASRRVSGAGRIPGSGAGVAGGRGCGDFLPGRPQSDSGTVWEPWLPGRADRGGNHRGKALPGRLRAEDRGDGPDVLR